MLEEFKNLDVNLQTYFVYNFHRFSNKLFYVLSFSEWIIVFNTEWKSQCTQMNKLETWVKKNTLSLVLKARWFYWTNIWKSDEYARGIITCQTARFIFVD